MVIDMQAELKELVFEPSPGFRNSELLNDAAQADCRGKRIGILVVTYNALSTIESVLKRITPNVWRNIEEVAIFDDASRDATYELAVGLKTLKNLPKLTVLKNQKNLGYGGNQKAGYDYFRSKGFDIVVLLHGDGQYAPEILAHMYNPLVRGEAEAVFGSRMMKTYGGPLKGGMPLYKFVGNRILTVCENKALGLELTEFHSGYRAYDLHALEKIDMSKMTNDFHYDTEIIIKLQHQGFRIHEIPIPTYYGTEICHVNGMRYAKDVLRAVYRYNQTKRSVAKYPEFSEYFTHYPIKQMPGSSHYEALRMAGSGNDVLDVGCGEGFLAKQIAGNNNRVSGTDFLPTAQHEDALEEYQSADLDGDVSGFARRWCGKRFDRILFLDLLEHVRRPEALLEQCRGLLKPAGNVVVSVPNVANITVRLMLLLGRFDYTERGILDRTHVHLYTRKTARQLLEKNGYRVIEEKLTVMPLELVLGLSADNPLMKAINLGLRAVTRLLPGLFGYQIMLVARPQAETA
jgi:2-polyprenyl-3-methyl-5-hydroxy-6-metoxy-1,4-benzoquinol methylase